MGRDEQKVGTSSKGWLELLVVQVGSRWEEEERRKSRVLGAWMVARRSRRVNADGSVFWRTLDQLFMSFLAPGDFGLDGACIALLSSIPATTPTILQDHTRCVLLDQSIDSADMQ
jgi:hypothetical protein